MKDDTQFKSVRIKDVQKTGDSYTITREDGWSFSFDPGPIEPKAGMIAQFYGPGIGFTVRGLVIDGHTFFYRTEEEEAQRHAEEVAATKRRHLEEHDQSKDGMRLRLEAYPEVFRKRIERFLRNAPDTAWEYQGYEMAVCDAALAIIKFCPDEEAISKWRERMFEKPHSKLDEELLELGLSGNQGDMATRLARWWYREPDNVWREHAAISLLTGCEEAGCVPEPLAEVAA